MTVMTECFKVLNSMLKYVCFTVIFTFNLTPSATGMTGRDGCKTLRFYGLVRLVVSCPSFLALKYKEIVLFHVLICVFQQQLQLVLLVIICYLNHFLLSWDVSYVRLRCGVVSVCRLLLGEFLWALSGTGMTSLLGCSEM